MFWHMAGLSAVSPVEAILDKENFTLEELLEEDEIIHECKALNVRLISFLRDRTQVKKLIQYTVEEALEDAEKERTFKFPFVASEIFTCEVDIILNALVEDEELMDVLFSFLDSGRPHSTLLAGYFSKVVICLLLRKTTPLMNYIQGHHDIVNKLVDHIGITSIMEVLIRLIGADEHIYANYVDSIQWLENMNVLEMIVDKFSSSECPEVHANAAEALCALTRHAPPALASKISSPSFVGRLFRHALEASRPKSVLVNLLSVCMSLLDPKRLAPGMYYVYSSQMTREPGMAASPETVEGMLENIDYLLKLLDLSSEDHILPTTYGKLQPPLGKCRLKIIEFISVLVAVGSEVSEKELMRLGALKRVFGLFFEYPFNNFLHHHVEHIILSCLESKTPQFVEHILRDCNLIAKILEVGKNFTLAVDIDQPTVPAEGRPPPRVGNIGHLIRIANKLVHLGNNNSDIKTIMQKNNDWVDWQTNVLPKRNSVENIFQWTCGRPTILHDHSRDSDDEDFQDRDYDVSVLANNLSQAFRCGIYNNDEIDGAHGSFELDGEDVYLDNESAEDISSLDLGNDRESGSIFTNSNWFAFEDERIDNDYSTGSIVSTSPNTEGHEAVNMTADDDVMVEEDKDLTDTVTSEPPEIKPTLDESDLKETKSIGFNRLHEWVECRGSSNSVDSLQPTNSADTSDSSQCSLPNGGLQVELQAHSANDKPDETVASQSSADGPLHVSKTDGGSPDSKNIDSDANPSQSAVIAEGNKPLEK